MKFEMRNLSDLSKGGFDTIIDVRSPSEFVEDHLPGAVNLPVLTDEERAKVGTIYVQDSPFKARKLGAALVARNAALHIEGPLSEKEGDWQPLIYCWRGGQRSNSLASILSQIGWRASVLTGGYQTYRRLVVDCLYEQSFSAPIVLLDGNTGTGKTELLRLLPKQGVQILDLEEIANHRGSVLGQTGAQPSQKAFETQLVREIQGLDPKKPVVIEAESSRIGAINLPPKLFEAMKQAPRIDILASINARATYLAESYKYLTVDIDALTKRLMKLVGIQGRTAVDHWIELAQTGHHFELARELITRHYDPRYAKARARRDANGLIQFSAADLSADTLASLSKDIADFVSAANAVPLKTNLNPVQV